MCDNECIEVVTDSTGTFTCIQAKEVGDTKLTVKYNGKSDTRKIYVCSDADQKNGLYCSEKRVLVNVTSEGPEVGEFNVGVEGEISEKLTAKFYTTDPRLNFTVEGKWVDYHTMHCRVVNYLSHPIPGELRIVVVERDNPENLIGVTSLHIDTPR